MLLERDKEPKSLPIQFNMYLEYIDIQTSNNSVNLINFILYESHPPVTKENIDTLPAHTEFNRFACIMYRNSLRVRTDCDAIKYFSNTQWYFRNFYIFYQSIYKNNSLLQILAANVQKTNCYNFLSKSKVPLIPKQSRCVSQFFSLGKAIINVTSYLYILSVSTFI